MKKIIFKVNRHYGDNNFKDIIENLVSIKISTFNPNIEVDEKAHCNIESNLLLIKNEENKI